MWWKLVALAVLTAVLVFAVIPVRTQALGYDPMNEPPPERGSFLDMLASMYLTPGSVLLIVLILAAAGLLAFNIVRGNR